MNILPNKSATLRNLKNGISKSIIKEFCSNQWKCGDFSPPVFNFICSNVHKCIAPINRDSAPMEQKIHFIELFLFKEDFLELLKVIIF